MHQLFMDEYFCPVAQKVQINKDREDMLRVVFIHTQEKVQMDPNTHHTITAINPRPNQRTQGDAVML